MSDLITRLPESRFEKKLYFLRNAGEIGQPLLDGVVEGAQRLQRHRLDPGAVVGLARHFRRHKPDILFLLDHHNALLWGRIAGILTRVPHYVVASHSTGKFGGKKSFRGTDRWLMEFTDRVVALSRSHARYLIDSEGIEAGKITVVENGVDAAAYTECDADGLERLKDSLGLSPADRVVIMVAAMRPEKAHDCLLAAAESLVATHSTLKFLVVGDGPRRPMIENMCRRLGLDNRVTFLGIRSDVARLLHVADVLVLPSHPVVETLPMCVLEAMAAGVPVVASRVGSIPDVIESGRNGLLIKPADSVQLAEAIARVIDDREMAQKLTSNAREVVEQRYSVDTMVARYAALFESLVEV